MLQDIYDRPLIGMNRPLIPQMNRSFIPHLIVVAARPFIPQLIMQLILPIELGVFL